jgi:hypothetical protein
MNPRDVFLNVTDTRHRQCPSTFSRDDGIRLGGVLGLGRIRATEGAIDAIPAMLSPMNSIFLAEMK